MQDTGLEEEIGEGKRPLKVKVKQSHYRPWTGPEVSRRLRLPDFKIIGT
jgi:hypothetical protein